jgi:hypothetical protein
MQTLSNSPKNIGLWSGAFAMSCICLTSIHFYSTLAMCLFMLGMPGGFAMMLFTGVHGDFNALGGIVYVVVNSIFFHYVFRFVAYLYKRFM